MKQFILFTAIDFKDKTKDGVLLVVNLDHISIMQPITGSFRTAKDTEEDKPPSIHIFDGTMISTNIGHSFYTHESFYNISQKILKTNNLILELNTNN